MKLSVIIPTYKTPQILDICLASAIEGQSIKNEIIVVVDGFYGLNKPILDKYKEHIKMLDLKDNVGTVKATNLGIYSSTLDYILVVNDDNVFPNGWDERLNVSIEKYKNNFILSPNQIEPFPSIFKEFVIKDFGRNEKTFDKFEFNKFCLTLNGDIEECGVSFPFFMKKLDYLRVGGLEQYPSPSGFVSDWEFFMKCEMNGLKLLRDFGLHFYHFVSVSTKNEQDVEKSKQFEINCHKYFQYKWGFSAYNKLLSK